MNRYRVIVARNRRDLHEYLAQRFAGDDSIRVVMERRSAERRRRWERHDPERRQRERRAGSSNEDVLSCHGLLILPPSSPQASEPPTFASQVREEEPLLAEGRARGSPDTKNPTEAARRWVSEGRRHLSVLLTLLAEQGYLEGQVEALEEKFASLDEMIRRLQSVRIHPEGGDPQAPSPDSPPKPLEDVPDRPSQP
jgi:hypothetical protein